MSADQDPQKTTIRLSFRKLRVAQGRLRNAKVNMKRGGSRRCMPPCFTPAGFVLLESLRVPWCPQWLWRLLNQFIEQLLRLLVQVGRRAIHHAGGLAGFIEQEHGWNSGDIAEGLRRGRIGNGPVQIGA